MVSGREIFMGYVLLRIKNVFHDKKMYLATIELKK